MRAAELLVRCLENEGVEYRISAFPGEENIDIMDALLESPIKFVTTRHEQGTAFMADVYRSSDRARRRVHGDTRTRRDESDHRLRGREHGSCAHRRHRGAGRDDAAPQGKPPDPRSGRAVPADHQVHRRRCSSRRSCRRSSGRRSRSRRPRSPAARSSTFPRTSPKWKSTSSRSRCRPLTRRMRRPPRSSRPRRSFRTRSTRSSSPATA